MSSSDNNTKSDVGALNFDSKIGLGFGYISARCIGLFIVSLVTHPRMKLPTAVSIIFLFHQFVPSLTDDSLAGHHLNVAVYHVTN